ncbi:hypothetical protein [Planctopirus hydrillae]|uniref:Uncharacterized protein n=1 Tax=Planctopirus hydrillae TaxID=1841610 RepID=A0A1C3E4B8_9PLAN|nr:hypothetical protein [Planctopirus hydrillae]ODA28063.1 hypothetical protein A6X21_14475 [Planctopirus hydrillae]
MKADTSKDKDNQKGRPKGAANVTQKTTTMLSRCPKCGSTERSVLSTTSQQFAGIAPDGEPYNFIIRRRVRCSGCGQVRIDREFSQRRAPEKE